MVYCGKPSASCRQCRRRNIKCDKRKVSCGQCTRAFLLCPGYHNPKDLVFRDETKATVRKAKASRKESSPLPLSLHPSIEECAKAKFVYHYILGDPSCTYNWVQTFYPFSVNDRHASIAMRAVSLAFISNEDFSNSTLDKARKAYCSALHLTNEALCSPFLVNQNTTLYAVLLLELFESLIRRNESSVEVETKHSDGAIAIAKLRGSDQFATVAGKKLFLQLCSNVVLRCINRGLEVPEDLINLRTNASQVIDLNHPVCRLHDLMIRFASCRSSMRYCESASNFLATVKAMDVEFREICKAIPADRQSEILNSIAHPEAFVVSPHVAPSRNWNIFCVFGCLLKETLDSHR